MDKVRCLLQGRSKAKRGGRDNTCQNGTSARAADTCRVLLSKVLCGLKRHGDDEQCPCRLYPVMTSPNKLQTPAPKGSSQAGNAPTKRKRKRHRRGRGRRARRANQSARVPQFPAHVPPVTLKKLSTSSQTGSCSGALWSVNLFELLHEVESMLCTLNYLQKRRQMYRNDHDFGVRLTSEVERFRSRLDQALGVVRKAEAAQRGCLKGRQGRRVRRRPR